MFREKLLSLFLFIFTFMQPKDFVVVSEELEYTVDRDMKYQTEDPFWTEESRHWKDKILDEYHVVVTGRPFRDTVVPQNVTRIILRTRYYFNGKIYTAVSNTINFRPGQGEDPSMHFNIPLESVWLADHDDKPVRDITEKVRRYAGPRKDFHGQKVPLEDFLYYDRSSLEETLPKIILTSVFGMKKTISTLDDFTNDLQIP